MPTKKPSVAKPTLSPTKAPVFLFPVTQLIGPGMLSKQAAQGYSVALTDNYILVGGFYDNNKTGAAWLYNRSGEFLQKLTTNNFGATTPKSEYMFGLSVAMTDDVIVIGAPRDSNRLGAVFVFTKQEGDKFVEKQKLMFINPWELTGGADGGTGTHLSNEVGFSVAVTPTGNRIVAGAPAHNYGRGAVVVYALNSGDDGQYEFEALLTTAEQVGLSVLGMSVAVNAEGNLIFAGAPEASSMSTDDYTNGGTWTFTRNNANVWKQRGGMLRGKLGTDPESLCKQGFSVSLNSAGTRALVGGPSNNELEGGAWVFDYNAKTNAWIESAFLYPQSVDTLPEFGHSVALSEDGTVAVLGGPKDSNNVGAACVFALQQETGIWLEVQKLTPTHTVDNARMGHAVAIRGKNTVLAGGPYHYALQGAVWLFEGF